MRNLIYSAFFAVCFVNVPAQAQTLDEHVSAENWSKASHALRREQRACRTAENTEACNLKIEFSRAWLSTQRAQAESNQDRKLQLLNSARSGYLAILQSRPKHSATRDNLVLVLEQLGDIKALEKQFETIKGAKRSAEVAEIIGDLNLAAKESVAAFSYYWKAYEKSENKRLLRSCLKAFEAKPQNNQAEQLQKLAQSKLDDSVAIRNQINAAIVRNHRDLEDATVERAALAWVMSKGAARTLTADRVANTFDVGRNSVFSELHRRLNEGFLGAPKDRARLNRRILDTGENDGWWNQSIVHSQALALAGWSAGHNHLLQGSSSAANNTWLGALYYAPATYEYSNALEGHPAVTLDLLTDLARLQQLYKTKLDPDGRQFRDIERLLFGSKQSAYDVIDLTAILRHHTVLGKMYADLGIFENGVRGAKFQLSNAIRTADRLAVKTAIPDPQPILAQLLADGYNCGLMQQVKSSCRKNTEKAREWYSRATLDYLDLDAVERADKSLQSVRKINPVLSPKEQQLEAIIKTRNSLSTAGSATEAKWLQQASGDLPKQFVERQQFKVYAEDAIKKGDAKSAEKALAISQKEGLIQNTVDLGKVKKLNRSISGK